MKEKNKPNPAQGAKPATKKKSAAKKKSALDPNDPKAVAAVRKFDAGMREAFAKHTGRVEIYLPDGSRATGAVPEIARLFALYCAMINFTD